MKKGKSEIKKTKPGKDQLVEGDFKSILGMLLCSTVGYKSDGIKIAHKGYQGVYRDTFGRTKYVARI